MSTIRTALKEQRPNLSDSSLRTYSSVLSNAYKCVYPKDESIEIKKFSNSEDFMKHIATMSHPSTLLAGLVVLTKNAEYQKAMNKKIVEHKSNEQNQTKNDKQKESMIPKEEVQTALTKLKVQADHIYKTKDTSAKAMNTLCNYILLCLASGIYMEPRRSLDWTELKIKNQTPDMNFYDRKTGKFIFAKYKTAKVYGTQTEDVPIELKKILDKWCKYNPNDFMLFNTKGGKLTSPNIATRLNEIFGKKISTSALRHIYISDKFKDMPSLKELQETASALGHSVPQMLEYIKK
jgi:hypothetical protein